MHRILTLVNQDVRARNNQILRKLCGSGKAVELAELRERYGLTAEDARAPDDSGHANEGLRQAARCGHAEVLEELLEFGLGKEDALAPHLNTKLPPCSEALMVALSHGYGDCIRVLRRGYRLSIRDLQKCVAVLALDRRKIHESAIDTVAELFRLRYPEARQVLKSAFVGGDVPMFQWISKTYKFTARDLFCPVEELAASDEASNPVLDYYDPELQEIDDEADKEAGESWEARVDFDGALRRVSFGAKGVLGQRESQIKGIVTVLIDTMGMTMESVRDQDNLALVRLAVHRRYPELVKTLVDRLGLSKEDVKAAFADMETNQDGNKPSALSLACAGDDQLMLETFADDLGMGRQEALAGDRLALAEALRAGAVHALTCLRTKYGMEPEDVYAAAEARAGKSSWKWEVIFGNRPLVSYLNNSPWSMKELDPDMLARPKETGHLAAIAYPSSSVAEAGRLLYLDSQAHEQNNVKRMPKVPDPVHGPEAAEEEPDQDGDAQAGQKEHKDRPRNWDDQMRDPDACENPVEAAKEAFDSLDPNQKKGLGGVYGTPTDHSALFEDKKETDALDLLDNEKFMKAAVGRVNDMMSGSGGKKRQTRK